ncbi:SAM-dependent methyltransferase [Allosalinactinospora lopnorensis]|uniref:SAM-dependent methyltransferase n=1 Tax=Allosalinactinospora lopnorensis TaxID=1352348 RepID=UPI000623CAFB|nr:SAM-dependent methyltransferase [Allosalinactinospora lopnorensis]
MADVPSSAGPGRRPPEIDTSVPHSARIYNYWLGSKDYYPIDREVGDQIQAFFPGIVDLARAQRAFLVRAVTYLVREAGIRQFLDIGTGLPTYNNTHEAAQALAPESRIVYVDHDPLVLAHARALLVGTPEGATDYVDADLRDPETILREAARTLDFSRPIALTLLGIMAHIPDNDEAHAILARLRESLPSGSYIAISDGADVAGSETREAYSKTIRLWNETSSNPRRNRTPQEFEQLFAGTELVEPGVVSTPLWRPDSTDIGSPRPLDVYAGLGRVP